MTLFDGCDVIGEWVSGNPNTIALDTEDKVEGAGSLEMTWASTEPTWGGLFYERPSEGMWDFSVEPVLRFRFKAHQTMPIGTSLSIVTAEEGDIYAWNVYSFNIYSKITSVGEWIIIDIDLRIPDSYNEFPDLRYVKQIGLEDWSYITDPTSFNVDFIENINGPPLPLEAYIEPTSETILLDESATFTVFVRGGTEPYIYEWYIDDELQSGETSDIIIILGSLAGDYVVKCIITDDDTTQEIELGNLKVNSPPSPPPPSKDTLKNQVRGIFVQPGWYLTIDWDTIATKCLNLGFNTAIIGIGRDYLWSNGEAIYYENLNTAIEAFNNVGLNAHVLLNVGTWSPELSWRAETDEGPQDWICFTKPEVKTHLLEIAESLATNYDLSGLVFDYIRWEDINMCLCDTCRDRFIIDTGNTDTNWPTDVLSGGKYFWDFRDWRMTPINEVVQEMRGAMLAINSDLVFAASVFAPWATIGNYWAYDFGQHPAEWINQGWLDFVCPMIGTRTIYGNNSVDERCRDSLDYFTAEADGKVPLIPFTGYWTTGDERDPDNFIEALELMDDYDIDGWIVWRYGGPGFPLAAAPDITSIMGAVESAGIYKETWAIQNLRVIINEVQATVSWTTTIPAQSGIEYGDTEIFVGTQIYGQFGRLFTFTDVDYLGGAINENLTFNTQHEFTIPATEQTQFRIQSNDVNDITITSGIMDWNMGEIGGGSKMEKTKLTHKTWKRKSKFF